MCTESFRNFTNTFGPRFAKFSDTGITDFIADTWKCLNNHLLLCAVHCRSYNKQRLLLENLAWSELCSGSGTISHCQWDRETVISCSSTINSRPITVVSKDPNDMKPLTPNHLLLMRGPSTPVVNEVNKRDTYRKWWKQVQFLAALFWRRWIKEYLPALQQSNKWMDPEPNLQVNYIVIVTDETMPRNVWPVRHILAVFPGDDGRVRSVRVKTATSMLTRPVSKLCLPKLLTE